MNATHLIKGRKVKLLEEGKRRVIYINLHTGEPHMVSVNWWKEQSKPLHP